MSIKLTAQQCEAEIRELEARMEMLRAHRERLQDTAPPAPSLPSDAESKAPAERASRRSVSHDVAPGYFSQPSVSHNMLVFVCEQDLFLGVVQIHVGLLRPDNSYGRHGRQPCSEH